MEKIKIRGLLHIASWILGGWGALVAVKGVYDLCGGEPEANLYSAEKWAFVTKAQWLRFSGFELVYGLCLLALAWTLRRYARFLPEVISRPKSEPDVDLFT